MARIANSGSKASKPKAPKAPMQNQGGSGANVYKTTQVTGKPAARGKATVAKPPAKKPNPYAGGAKKRG